MVFTLEPLIIAPRLVTGLRKAYERRNRVHLYTEDGSLVFRVVGDEEDDESCDYSRSVTE